MNKAYRALTECTVPSKQLQQRNMGHLLWPDGTERHTIRLKVNGQALNYHSKRSVAYPYTGVSHEATSPDTGLWFTSDGVSVCVGGLPIFSLVPHPVSEPIDLSEYFCVYPDTVWLPGLGMHQARRRVPLMRGYEATREKLADELSIYVGMLPPGTLERVLGTVERDISAVVIRLAQMLLAYRESGDINRAINVAADIGVQGVKPEHVLIATAYADLMLAQSSTLLGLDFTLGLRQLVRVGTSEVLPVCPEIPKW